MTTSMMTATSIQSSVGQRPTSSKDAVFPSKPSQLKSFANIDDDDVAPVPVLVTPTASEGSPAPSPTNTTECDDVDARNNDDDDNASRDSDISWNAAGATAAIMSAFSVSTIHTFDNESHQSCGTSGNSIASEYSNSFFKYTNGTNTTRHAPRFTSNNRNNNKISLQQQPNPSVGRRPGLPPLHFILPNDDDNVSDKQGEENACLTHSNDVEATRTDATSLMLGAENENDETNKEEEHPRYVEIKALIRQVMPGEEDNVDEMLLEFQGREQELVDTLFLMTPDGFNSTSTSSLLRQEENELQQAPANKEAEANVVTAAATMDNVLMLPSICKDSIDDDVHNDQASYFTLPSLKSRRQPGEFKKKSPTSKKADASMTPSIEQDEESFFSAWNTSRMGETRSHKTYQEDNDPPCTEDNDPLNNKDNINDENDDSTLESQESCSTGPTLAGPKQKLTARAIEISNLEQAIESDNWEAAARAAANLDTASLTSTLSSKSAYSQNLRMVMYSDCCKMDVERIQSQHTAEMDKQIAQDNWDGVIDTVGRLEQKLRQLQNKHNSSIDNEDVHSDVQHNLPQEQQSSLVEPAESEAQLVLLGDEEHGVESHEMIGMEFNLPQKTPKPEVDIMDSNDSVGGSTLQMLFSSPASSVIGEHGDGSSTNNKCREIQDSNDSVGGSTLQMLFSSPASSIIAEHVHGSSTNSNDCSSVDDESINMFFSPSNATESASYSELEEQPKLQTHQSCAPYEEEESAEVDRSQVLPEDTPSLLLQSHGSAKHEEGEEYDEGEVEQTLLEPEVEQLLDVVEQTLLEPEVEQLLDVVEQTLLKPEVEQLLDVAIKTVHPPSLVVAVTNVDKQVVHEKTWVDTGCNCIIM